jgi:ribonuclease BN (tRNA processing enzyme)
MNELASAISERPGFFDDAFGILEYDPSRAHHVGDLTISFVQGQHYVPAWGCTITDSDGRRIVISGDTGPNDGIVAAARGADLLVLEATLTDADHDDPRRGHLTPEEAIDMAARAGVPRTILVHYRANLRDRVERACAGRPGAQPGRPGLVVEIGATASRQVTDASEPLQDGPADSAPDGAVPDAGGPHRQATEGVAGAHLP